MAFLTLATHDVQDTELLGKIREFPQNRWVSWQHLPARDGTNALTAAAGRDK